MESMPERQLHTHPHRLIPGVRKPRHLSGPATALAWESTNRRDKRGNAADNSRSCTVHTRSTFHHTHWWNLLPVNMHCSKHHYLLQMKEKNHLHLKSAQLQIWYIRKLDSFASLNWKLERVALFYLQMAFFQVPWAQFLSWNSKMDNNFKSYYKVMRGGNMMENRETLLGNLKISRNYMLLQMKF